uniref:Uncharacterized protein n=1 Tax=Eutreptiella gymnastica TaxID=73025 RepID=A0A7S1NVP1_9EUGL
MLKANLERVPDKNDPTKKVASYSMFVPSEPELRKMDLTQPPPLPAERTYGRTWCEDKTQKKGNYWWQDKQGRTCEDYVKDKLCTKSGLVGAGWNKQGGMISDQAVDGIDAFDACCKCGGGSNALCHVAWEDAPLKDGMVTCDPLTGDKVKCTRPRPESDPELKKVGSCNVPAAANPPSNPTSKPPAKTATKPPAK